MKYVRKTVVEAFQYYKDEEFPAWAFEAFANGKIKFTEEALYIVAKDRNLKVNEGDYIINKEYGELMACKKEAFERVYERVGEC